MRLLPLFAVMILCTTALTAMAQNPMSGAELLDSCRAYREEPRTGPGLFCAAYIRGFLDGASTVVDSRLRSGAERDKRQRPPQAPPVHTGDEQRPYCIDEPVAIDRIVVQLLAHALERSDADQVRASDLLDATLRQMYDCRR